MAQIRSIGTRGRILKVCVALAAMTVFGWASVANVTIAMAQDAPAADKAGEPKKGGGKKSKKKAAARKGKGKQPAETPKNKSGKEGQADHQAAPSGREKDAEGGKGAKVKPAVPGGKLAQKAEETLIKEQARQATRDVENKAGEDAADMEGADELLDDPATGMTQDATRGGTEVGKGKGVVGKTGDESAAAANQNLPGQARGIEYSDRPVQQAQIPLADMTQNQLLDYINSLDLGLSGAELRVEVVGGQVVVKGSPEDVRKVEALIRTLDRFRKTKAIETVVLKNRSAEEMARTVTDALKDLFPPSLPEDQKLKLTAAGNVIIVAALPEDMDLVLSLIDRLDNIPVGIPSEWLSFEVVHRKASDVLKEVQSMLSKMRTQLGLRQELAMQAIDATNTIQVLAPESERAKIQAIIDAVDVEPKEDWGEIKLAVFPLLHSKAEDFLTVVDSLLKTPEGQDAANEQILRLSLTVVDPKTGERQKLEPIDLSRTNRLIADPGTNSLIVATVEKNIPGFTELIRLLDSVPLAEDIRVEIVPLRFANAEDLEDRLSRLFEQGGDLFPSPDMPSVGGVPKEDTGKALAYTFRVVADERTNVLVLAGRPEQVALAKRLLESLDAPFRYKFPISVIRLTHSDALRVGKVLSEMLEKRQEGYEKVTDNLAREQERVFLTVDVYNNALLVSAAEPNIQEITEIVKALDIPVGRNVSQIGVIRCAHLSAKSLVDRIKELWQRRTKMLGEANQFQDEPVVAADERSNALIVAASPEDFAAIQKLVEDLEKEKPVDNIRIFGLKFADATQMQGKLDELFQGAAQLTGDDTKPTFIAEERGNSLIVAATQDTMERVEDLVKRLDVESGPTTAVLVAYPLNFANAVTLAQKLDKLFQDRGQGGSSQNRTTPVVIVPFEGANSLVVSASRDDHVVVTDLLKLLDQKSDLSRQVQAFPLQYARAEDASQALESLFARSGGSGGDTGRPDAIAVVPDARANALIVWASPAQLEQVAAMVKKIDQTMPVVNMGMRVVQLKQALAQDFAQVLQEALFGQGNNADNAAVMVTFQEHKDDGTVVEHKLLRQDVHFTPDPRTNSIFVWAPKDSIDALESMIRNIDQIRPTVNEIRMFELYNSNAENVVTILRDLYSGDGVGRTGQGESEIRTAFQLLGYPIEGIPALAGQTLRFVADARTNTVIAAGAPIDLQMIEGLVRTLDSYDTQTRVARVYKPNTLQPQEIADALLDWLRQEDEAYQGTDEQSSQFVQNEKKVSLVSLGGTGEQDRGSSVVIGASPRRAPEILDLIQQLDRPEPQVRISALVAEVILDDRLELGVEFAAQDLNFSETAVLGPNGTVIGDNDAFDSVVGTDIGASGPGGFSFTVTGEDFNFLLRALQTESKLEVLSRPTIMVENNRVGNIDVGDRIPIPTTSSIGDNTNRTQTSFRYEDVGIKLNVVPHITPDGFVRMDITAEISQLSSTTVTLTEGLTAPVISQRKLESSVTIRDGETIVLGGLITSSQERGENKIPLLGDLPWVGVLFRSTKEVGRRTELLTVLTVEIIRTPEDARAMSIRERDMGESSGWVRGHRFMEGLRIVPDPALMGPRPGGGPMENSPTVEPKVTPQQRELYGPKPRRYGPDLSKPVARYGPKVPSQTTPRTAPSGDDSQERAELAGLSEANDRSKP